MKFKRTRRGIRVDPDQIEATVLGQCARDLIILLGAEDATEDAAEQDPLAALVGMPTGEPTRSADPALARLLPDGYGEDDPAASKEFRRYTEDDLRAGKRADAQALLATLPASGGTVLLDREMAVHWLGCLNDLRLVLGVRLGVTEDTDLMDAAADPTDPVLQASHVYGWLGWLQESLLSCLDRG